MKCFLHIGTEKTGTTTVQNFFNSNRNMLLKYGFIYTKAAGAVSNRMLSIAAYNSNRRDEFTKRHCIHSDDELIAFQKKVVHNLQNEIEAIGKSSSVLIFSSEHLQSRLFCVEEIDRLKSIICSLGVTDTSVVLYLRRPADIANSLYSTAVKNGSCLDAPPSPKNHRYWNNVCNHKNTIERFSLGFGSDSVIPRLFDRNTFSNGSLVDDVMSVIGIPIDSEFNVSENSNESLTPMGIKLLVQLNKDIPKFVNGNLNPIRANLAAYVSKHFSSGNKYLMPSHLYEEYDLEFKESNDWVRERYFPQLENLFSQEIPCETNQNSSSDEDIERISSFIADFWNDKQRRILNLSKLENNQKAS